MNGRSQNRSCPPPRRKCEELPRIDVRELRSHGLLHGGSFSCNWHIDDTLVTAEVVVSGKFIDIRYRMRDRNGYPQERLCAIRMSQTPCRFGGSRLWLHCTTCARPRLVLYGLDLRGSFSCRVCLNLCYVSESESPWHRLFRKQRKLQARLAEDESKPKWMRWNTYERIQEALDAVEVAKDRQVAAMMRRIAPGDDTSAFIDEFLLPDLPPSTRT